MKALRLEGGRVRLNGLRTAARIEVFLGGLLDAGARPSVESWNVDALSLREVRRRMNMGGKRSRGDVGWDRSRIGGGPELPRRRLRRGRAGWMPTVWSCKPAMTSGWMDGSFCSELEGRLEGDRVTVVLGDSRYGSASSPVPLTGVMESESDDLGWRCLLRLCPRPRWEAVLPPNVREVLAPAMEGVTGSAEVELSIGRCTTRGLERPARRIMGRRLGGAPGTEWPGRIVLGGRVATSVMDIVGAVVAMSGASGMEGCGAIDRCGRGRGRVQG